MADLENDDDLENEEDDHDLEYECYNYDDNEMYTMYLKHTTGEQVKIEKTKDYYELFVKMLKTEPKNLHAVEHLWVLGIDESNYSVCVYVVTHACVLEVWVILTFLMSHQQDFSKWHFSKTL